jgi:hypothetical protein
LYDSATGKTEPALLPVLPNVALRRPAACSSIEGWDYACSQAVDGDLATRWSSQFNDPQWIYLDLGRRMSIERVILHWETAFGKAYQLQTSDDAVHWTSVYSTTASDGGVDNLDLSGTGRYVRLVGTQRGTGYGYSLWEFQVYARTDRVYLPFVARRATTTPPAGTTRSLQILVDDFRPQPRAGTSAYDRNRLGGDRGVVNGSILDWSTGRMTTTIATTRTWGGLWLSLNHLIGERLPIDFSAVLPPQILPPYQSQITGIRAVIVDGTPGRTFRLELKDKGELRWQEELVLESGRQVVHSDLPALGDANELLWVLDDAAEGDFVVLDSLSFTATTQVTDTATAAFAWSYGMLLNNWDPATGLVRDKARDVSGEFDAIQATGTLAAATAVADQLGIVSRSSALEIVGRISDTLHLDLPQSHGLWPHFVEISPTGEITIVPGTEWSSVDTVIAGVGLLAAQGALGMDTSGTEQMLEAIDWNDLLTEDGISHGYTYEGTRIPLFWHIFGGESWLVALAYAGATGQVAPMTYPSPPTANGSGFIDELAWLFVEPPTERDYWGTDWPVYRVAAGDNQLLYYTTHVPESCHRQLGLFGLSAAEVPDPSLVPPEAVYQAFGVGGQLWPANDGFGLYGTRVVVPHEAALIASLRPEEALAMWGWLMNGGYFTPLNNAESLMFGAGSDCGTDELVWNHLKGSWNLSLQTLGWGRYLAQRAGQTPILWQATSANPFVRRGYLLLVPSEPSSSW